METLTRTLRRQKEDYAHGHELPLGSYLVTLGVYTGAVVTLALIGESRRARIPAIRPWDLFVMAAATHKVSRVLAKDPVTSPLRAPFTSYRETAAPAELSEDVRGEGARHAVGELLSCPFCTAQWIATAYAAGLVFAPRFTMLAGSTMAAVAGADWLQLAYARLQQQAQEERHDDTAPAAGS